MDWDRLPAAVLGLLPIALIWLAVIGLQLWDNGRDRRPLPAAAEVRRQLWEMEAQIREELLSDEEREWRRQYREREAAIKQEAWRRLGLPEDGETP